MTKCMEYEHIWALFQGFEPLFGSQDLDSKLNLLQGGKSDQDPDPHSHQIKIRISIK
jgi:hypothetical protein